LCKALANYSEVIETLKAMLGTTYNSDMDVFNMIRSAQTNAAGAQEACSVAKETTAQAISVKANVKELAAVIGYQK
jgi:hypothetical protein